MTLSMEAEDQTSRDVAKRASGSSFYAAMRILPRAQRSAMFEIYSFCRLVDDIADDPGDRDKRITELAQWRRDIVSLFAGTPSARVKGFIAPLREFGLQREDFMAVIDGMEMDIHADIRAPDLATLDLYCDRVASAVGRLSVRVFGMALDDGQALAHHLGRALQLTNILRDLDEDAAIGRLYLPKEALNLAGITARDPAKVLSDPKIGIACEMIVSRVREHFREADLIMARSPRRSVRAPKIMSEAYKVYFNALIQRGFDFPRRRIRLSRARFVWLILRYGLL